MKNAAFLLAILLLAAATLSAQDTKGAQPLNPSTTQPVNQTRAVVVGISDYQDPAIPDLQFAHRDAEAFAQWLQSPAGGSVSEDNIQLLLNAQATKGKVSMALTWLYEQSKQGDRAIIYFSGHGDVEKKLFSQPGYLLCRDAPPVVYMSGGTLSVSELQEVIATLSLANKAEVLVVTDACRAGALTGAPTGGPQQTTASLQQQFANEVKILSCQANEFSIEGEQWGGGRGAFSYVLEDALYGLADRDKDAQIKLKELGRYLEDQVPAQTDPQVQNPVVMGDREAWIASVDKQILAQRETGKTRRQTNFSTGDMRGMEALVIAQADSSIQSIYQTYLAAASAGDLMRADSGKLSANACYEILIHEPGIGTMHGFLKRHFVAALVDESQQVMNRLLKTDPMVVGDMFSRTTVFEHIPGYLERAAEILGEGHFIYKNLKAKQLFFEAKTILPEHHPGLSADSVARLAARKYEQALEYDPQAAYVHVELGFLCFYKLVDWPRARSHADQALELVPDWLYANYLASTTRRNESSDEGLGLLMKCLEMDSTFLPPYEELFFHYLYRGKPTSSNYYRDKFIQKAQEQIAADPIHVPVVYWNFLGGMLYYAGRHREAERVLLTADSLSKGTDWGACSYLAQVYSALGECEKAKAYFKRQVELAPHNTGTIINVIACLDKENNKQEIVELLEWLNTATGQTDVYIMALLGETLQALGRQEEASLLFRKILDMLPDFSSPYEMNMKSRSHLGLSDRAAMQRTIDEGLKRFPNDMWVYYQAACLYSLAKDEKRALEWLEKAFENGFADITLIGADSDLDNIRQSTAFKALMKKHFPEQVKD